jgi:hypothetical protein
MCLKNQPYLAKVEIHWFDWPFKVFESDYYVHFYTTTHTIHKMWGLILAFAREDVWDQVEIVVVVVLEGLH